LDFNLFVCQIIHVGIFLIMFGGIG